jgi:hypothetical protein
MIHRVIGLACVILAVAFQCEARPATKPLFSLPKLAGTGAAQHQRVLGKPRSTTAPYRTYKVAGTDEVLVRFRGGRAVSYTVYLTKGAPSAMKALSLVGVDVSAGRIAQTAPAALWWTGKFSGVRFVKVGVMRDSGGVSPGAGWNIVQAEIP